MATDTSVNISTLIAKSPELFEGRPYIAGTGITVRRIVGWYKLGYDADGIAKELDHLTLAQVYAALAYYHTNKELVEADIAEEEVENRRIEEAQLHDKAQI